MEQRAAEDPGEDHSVGVGWEEDPVRRGPTGLRKDPGESVIRGGWKELQAGLPVLVPPKMECRGELSRVHCCDHGCLCEPPQIAVGRSGDELGNQTENWETVRSLKRRGKTR